VAAERLPQLFNLLFDRFSHVSRAFAIAQTLQWDGGQRSIATYDNAFLIYNPQAGKFGRNGEQLLQRTIEALAAGGHRVTPVPTTGPATAGAIARDCVMKGADIVIAAGGDGTINEVANGLVHSHVPLAILPGGTANVLAVEIETGTHMVRAAERLGSLLPERVSVGLLKNAQEQRHFVLMAGAGLDALIVYNIDAKLKAQLGKAAYWIGGFSQLGRPLPEFDVRVNGKLVRCSFALASRVKNYGGDLLIARGASLFSDHFELILFEGAHSLPYMKYFIGVLTNRLASMQGVSVIKAESVELECASDPSIYVQVDGEFAGRLPVSLEIVPRALTLLVPESFREHKLRHG
jgi:YegS/Rv2252/BmrU family lipid kinase